VSACPCGSGRDADGCDHYVSRPWPNSERADHWVPTPVGYALCTSCGRECVPSDLAEGYCGMGCRVAFEAGRCAAFAEMEAEARRVDSTGLLYNAAEAFEHMAAFAAERSKA
jgi:hypothetical protein